MNVLSGLVMRHPRKIIAIWCILVLGGGFLSTRLTNRLQNGGYGVPGSQSARAVDLSKHRFNDQSAAQAYVSVITSTPALTTNLHDAELIGHALESLRGVTATGTPLVSRDRRGVLLPVMLSGGIGTAQTYIPTLQRTLNHVDVSPAKVQLVGQTPTYKRYLVDAKSDLQRSALISLPLTTIILLVAFLSITAALLPLVLALACLGVTFGALYLLTYGTQLGVFVQDTVLILGLGLSIDFSLFMVTRVRECLTHEGANTAEAVTTALTTTGRAILVSGLTVAASIAGMFLVGVGFFSSMAIGAIGAALLAAASALTLAPSVLVILGPRLERFPIRVAVTAARSGALWKLLAGFVVRRRVLVVMIIVPILVALSLPTAGLRIRVKLVSILPASDQVRQASAEVARVFGPGFEAPTTILARTTPSRLTDVVDREPGVVETFPPQEGSHGWARVASVLAAAPDSSAAEHILRRMRSSLKRVFGGNAVVGGPTAEWTDLGDRINERTPLVVLAVLIVEFCVLTAVFRAPVLALKAAATTLLSVTATLGLTTLLFGANGTIAYFVPLLLFVTVFGLSTDYEIFLLSRVREEHESGASTVQSLQNALVRSARSITLAGITMSIVFFSFASASLMPFRQLGVGMGIAIMLDVTVVRGLLVPATVALLGDLNWWRPGRPRVKPLTAAES